MTPAVLAHLGLDVDSYTAPPPAAWTPETLELALRRLRALGAAQLRVLAATGAAEPELNLNLALCGAERTLRGGDGELLVERVEWQVAHLHVLHAPELFERALDELVRGEGGELEAELVNADGAARPVRLGRWLVTDVAARLRDRRPFWSGGPWIRDGSGLRRCFRHAVACALLQQLRLPDESIEAFRAGDPAPLAEHAARLRRRDDADDFRVALIDAALGRPTARARLGGFWPPTNSGVETAEGRAALYLLGADFFELPLSRWSWHRMPGQPGSQLERLLHQARLSASVGRPRPALPSP